MSVVLGDLREDFTLMIAFSGQTDEERGLQTLGDFLAEETRG